jgi:hypothetical protein
MLADGESRKVVLLKIAINHLLFGKTKNRSRAAIMMKNDDVAEDHHPLNRSTESFYAWKITG